MIQSQEKIKYINHQKILVMLFIVPHLELIQGRGMPMGLGNITLLTHGQCPKDPRILVWKGGVTEARRVKFELFCIPLARGRFSLVHQFLFSGPGS